MGSYVIEFHRDGLRVAVSLHAGPLEAAKTAAQDGLIEQQADVASISDTESLEEVCEIEGRRFPH